MTADASAPAFPLLSESAEDRSFFNSLQSPWEPLLIPMKYLWVKRCFFPQELFFFSFRAAATVFLLLQRQLAAEIPPMPNVH